MRSRPRSNSSSSDGSLAKGNRVLIVATDNTLQRVPQYIGQVGIVKEAPGKKQFHFAFCLSALCNVLPLYLYLVHYMLTAYLLYNRSTPLYMV